MSDPYNDPYMKFAFALDGLIRSRLTGDGGEEFARKCIGKIGESLRAMHEPPPDESPEEARCARAEPHSAHRWRWPAGVSREFECPGVQ